MAESHYEDPELAALYDPFDPDRSDLDVYAHILDEPGAHSVLDAGCGTGTLGCLLALRGKEMTGLDPALAELEIARAKPGADRVRWLHAEAAAIPPLGVDAVTMTGNLAQVFLTDEDWAAALRAVWATLRPGGWFIFETRDPSHRAWLEWTLEHSYQRMELPGVGPVASWDELTGVELPLISFRGTFVFEAEGRSRSSDSTLRFRSRAEIEHALRWRFHRARRPRRSRSARM